ncbi:ABC transporter transmembrane domain-containing protein, partial [Polaromonas sp. P5_D5]
TPLWQFNENKPRPRIRWRDILGKVVGLKRSLALIFLLAVFVEIAALLSPLLIQFVTDQALPAGDKELVGVLIFGFTLLLLLRICVEGMRSWAVLVLGSTFSVQWLANVYSHLLKLPVAYFERRSLADVLSRFGVISLIQSTLTVGFVEALLDGCLVLGVFTMMLLYSIPLSFIGIAAALMYAIGRASLYGMRRQFAYLSITTHVAQQTTFIESIENISSIRTLNNGSDWIARWTSLIVAEKNADFSGARLDWAFRLMRLLIFGLASVFVIGFGAIEVIDKKLSIGMLLALVAYQDLFVRRVGDFIDRIFEFKLLELQGGRLSDIILARIEPDPMPTVSALLKKGDGTFEGKS